MGFSFVSPWILLALLALPLLWWLLRLMPPQPKTVALPTFFLLKDLTADIRTPAHTPWWVLLLRALMLALFIFAFAAPVHQRGADMAAGSGPVVIAFDNGYAAAVNWDQRVSRAREILSQAARAGRNVIVLPTAPAAGHGRVEATGAMTAEEAEKFISRLSPQPWQTDHAAAAGAAGKIAGGGLSFFFSDGLSPSQSATGDLLAALQKSRALTVIADEETNAPLVLRRGAHKPGRLSLTVERPRAGITEKFTLQAQAADGSLLDAREFSFAADAREAQAVWELVEAVRDRVARVTVKGVRMASAVWLTDSRFRQRPVGILADAGQAQGNSFLNEIYYLRRALEDGGGVSIGKFSDLSARDLSVMIWPDSVALTAEERAALTAWVEGGGLLLRFAGSNLAANVDDDLLPVPLRHGQRAMQGAMTWEKPLTLGAIPPESPLYGLGVPDDVTVARQVLADPSPEVFERTWLQLSDGTPLVTGAARGQGHVVLVHTTAGADWSDFCYSGLYVESLNRLIALSAGRAAEAGQAFLPPVSLLDGFGALHPAGAGATAVAADAVFTPSPRTPPGIYGRAESFAVFNAGDGIGPMRVLDKAPAGVFAASYELTGERDLKPLFFRLALLLLAVDTLAMLFLRGLVSLPRRAAVAVMLLLVLSTPAMAEEAGVDMASSIYLAYVETGDAATDNASYNGLMALKNVINTRTNIKVQGVRGVNPAADKLYFYPFIYWPMGAGAPMLPATAARNIQDYMAQGGLVMIDTRDAGGDNNNAGTRSLHMIGRSIQIAELAPVGEGHILTKSFYLLDDFPGRHANGKVWAEKEPNPNYDAVTSVIIGGNDWAAAWGADANALPGGARQREMAWRFGVNVIMMALAGNYKADQLHIPFILERLGR